MELETLFDQIRREMEEELSLSLSNVSCCVENRGLRSWEAACCWIEDNGEVMIQLRPSLKSGSFLGYTTREIIRHELVHAARFWEREDRFEEILACEIAAPKKGGIRSSLPSLFQTSRESLLFVLLFFISWGLGVLFAESYLQLFLYLLPSILIVLFCIGRLLYNRQIVRRVLVKFPLSKVIRMDQRDIAKCGSIG